MARSAAIANYDTTLTELVCPRCKLTMKEIVVNESLIDRCNGCGGTFFDQGEMFTALGKTADEQYWDRPEIAGKVRESDMGCPRCKASMLAIDVAHEDQSVEIDRCNKCQGVWLDGGEAERIMAIGEKMASAVEAEREKAQADLDALGDVDFRPPSLLYRFLSIFKK